MTTRRAGALSPSIRWRLAAVLVLVTLAVAALGAYRLLAPRYATAEYAALQGDWRLVVYTDREDGQPSWPVEGAVITIQGDQIMPHREGSKPLKLRLFGDDGALKRVDLLIDGESEPDPGVYRLDGDTLTACFANHRGEARPTDFQLRSASENRWLIKLQRVRRVR